MEYTGPISVKCPFCGFENKILKHIRQYEWIAIYCSCENLFIYKVELEPRITTRKVEGEA